MNDLDLLVAGAMVSFLSVAGAYIAIRQRANETPVSSYSPSDPKSPSSAAAKQKLSAS
jgi:hypothetical protein